MKRIPYWLLGLLLLITGLVVEAGFISLAAAVIYWPWVLLVASVIVFSVIIGNCISKYGFKEETIDRRIEAEQRNISL